jgi:hypothetical protein
LDVVVAVPAILTDAGSVVAVVEEPAGAPIVVAVAKVCGFFLEPPTAIATAMKIITTTAVITQAHHCL